MIKAFIFDVDGTLVDSVDMHAEAWRRAFLDSGRDIPFDDLRRQIGKGSDQLLPVFLTRSEIEAEGDEIDKRRAAIVQKTYLSRIEGFPKVRCLFERLAADGIAIALASSAKLEELQTYKRRADIEDLVAEETSADDTNHSKPHGDIFQAALDRLGGMDPSDAIVVGDTPYDAQAASKAGLRTIGVLCGGFPESDLRDAGCVAIFRDPADMLAQYNAVIACASKAPHCSQKN